MTDTKKGFEKTAFHPTSTAEKSPSIIEKVPTNQFPVINGLSIEMTNRKQYRIKDINTGLALDFVLQGAKEALDMQNLLSRLMIVQESCRDTQKLRDSCAAYTEASILGNGISDLRIDNSNLIPGRGFRVSDYMLPSEAIETVIRGSHFQHSLPDGTHSFVESMAKFLNTTQDFQVQTALKNKTKQVAQK